MSLSLTLEFNFFNQFIPTFPRMTTHVQKETKLQEKDPKYLIQQ